MRKLLFGLILISSCFFCRAQHKAELLRQYFLGIPVTDSLSAITRFVDSSWLFGVDSIVKGKGIYTSFKQSSPYANLGNHLVKALVNHYVYYDSISKEFYDTANVVLISFYFSPASEKNHNALYTQIKKGFRKVYSFYDDGRGSQEDVYWESVAFKKELFDNFPQLTIYKGNSKQKGLYVSLMYDNRGFYQITDPKISIRVRSY